MHEEKKNYFRICMQTCSKEPSRNSEQSIKRAYDTGLKKHDDSSTAMSQDRV